MTGKVFYNNYKILLNFRRKKQKLFQQQSFLLF